jgi:hypothetical protein
MGQRLLANNLTRSGRRNLGGFDERLLNDVALFCARVHP